jgi:hypothetical protein
LVEALRVLALPSTQPVRDSKWRLLRETTSVLVWLCPFLRDRTPGANPHPRTSSKSTKLVHGGVRYLQKAVMELDYEQYKLVREALHERHIFLQTAPYLSHMHPIMLPIYK